MTDLSNELAQIAKEMDELLERAQEMGITRTLEQLRKAAREVGAASSTSWFGYQANVYFKDFGKPSKEAYFSKRYGLSPRPQHASVRRNEGRRTTGNWKEYDPEVVIGVIVSKTDDPNMDDASTLYQKAKETILKSRKDLLSILEIASDESPSDFLSNTKQEVDGIPLVTEQEILSKWEPEEHATDDQRAIRDGLLTPPHLRILARVEEIAGSLEAAKTTRDIAKYAESHIARLKQRHLNPTLHGTRAFIGHGHSPAWRELKDFLHDRLELPTDEFNRVPTAGIATASRLSSMLETTGIAFLIMTGEDEQADGSVRARENVVHEAGLFQGRLGFQRAIVLLEEDCQEFSNVTGLGQIRFPSGNIASAFEEIRKVLEREGFIGQ